MRITIIACYLLVFTACNRNATSVSTDNGIDLSSLAAAKDYKPNPDEVVISAKLISYQNGVANVEVVRQIATGFGAKAVLNPGDALALSSDTKPSDNFICAFEYADLRGDQKAYRITRFLK